jgi:predicted acetyltransferase
MPIEIRPYAGDVGTLIQAIMVPFGWEPHDEDIAVFAPTVELDRTLGAYDADRLVGTASAFSLRVAVPGGGELPMAGVTMVGVLPTHRRRGILRQMMRRQLDDVRDAGEPLAGLWASEGAIYQRFGYGLAAFGARFEIEGRRAAFRSAHRPSGTMRLVTRDEAAATFPSVFDAVWHARPGSLARSETWWRAEFFHDPEHQRRGGSSASYVLHETDGRTTGYARYRLYPEWDERGPKSALEVHEAIGVTPAATLDLWRYLLDVDLVATIRSRNLPVDHPLLLAVAEPRRLGWGLADTLWLRVVDVPGAVSGRGWAADGSLVMELTDEFCPWNHGRWELTVEGGHGSAMRTDRAADLGLDAADLGAAYLGGVTLSALADAGRVSEISAGAAARADAMLEVPLAPWCSQGF